MKREAFSRIILYSLIITTILSIVYFIGNIYHYNIINLLRIWQEQFVFIILSYIVIPIILWCLYFKRKSKWSRIALYIGLTLFIIFILIQVLSVQPIYSCHSAGFPDSYHCHWFEPYHLH